MNLGVEKCQLEPPYKFTSCESPYARLDPLMLEHWKHPMSARRWFGIRRRSRRQREASADKSFVRW